MNIKPLHGFITSAAAKVDLVVRMRDACHAQGAKIHVADCRPLSAALHFGDFSTILPPMQNPQFLSSVLGYCKEHGIAFLLPTSDADVRYFSLHVDALQSQHVFPIVSDVKTVARCQDKIAFYDCCIKHQLPVLPRIVAPREADFPCFVRSRFGAASQSCFVAEHSRMLEGIAGKGPWPDLLIQPLANAMEYTVDAFFDRSGKAVQWIARKRVRVKAGESVVGETVQLDGLDPLINQLAGVFCFVGPVTVQLFHSPELGFALIEVNARVGGGAALGIEAGLDTPARILQLAGGDLRGLWAPRSLKYGMKMLRYSSDLFLEPGHD